MTDNQSNLSYQDILDKYAESINPSTDSKIPEEKIKPEPELEPINPPETILTPEEEEVVKSQPQPEIQPQPEPQPEPQSEPQPEIQTQPEAPPQIEAPPSPQAINSPPVAEAIISPSPLVSPESSNEGGSDLISPPKKSNHFFKYLFFFSLIIFIVVLVLVVISFLNSQKPVSSSRDIPQNNFSPTSLPTDFCELNNQQYLVGATFTADDGCNTCTCGEDLTVTCTTNTCDLTPTTSTTSGTPTKSATTSAIPTDWKTYSNQIYNVSFKYPNSFSVSDELPKTKTQGGPKTALELTDTKNNYLISIIIDPAGFGPIFADKQITLDYSTSKGLFSSKITPVSKVDEENLLPDKKVLWYQFDSDSFSNITIITNAEKTDTKLETLTNQILSTFKFL